MDVLKVYKKNKRIYRKNKELALLASMQEIDLFIANADVDINFLKVYKFYKYLLLITNTIIPNMLFGLGTGVIATVMGFFLNNINDVFLLTFSNLLFVTIGFMGIIVLYLLSCRRVVVYILLPYTVKKLDEKIDDFNSYCLSEQMVSNRKHKVKIRRIIKHCKIKQNNKGERPCKHNRT